MQYAAYNKWKTRHMYHANWGVANAIRLILVEPATEARRRAVNGGVDIADVEICQWEGHTAAATARTTAMKASAGDHGQYRLAKPSQGMASRDLCRRVGLVAVTSLSLSLSLARTHAHTHTHTHPLSKSHDFVLGPSLVLSLSLFLSIFWLTCARGFSDPLSSLSTAAKRT